MRIRRWLLCVLSVLYASALVSCGGGSNTVRAANGTLRVFNNTTLSITVVNLDPVSQPTWGPNQLTSSIPAGGTRDITGVPPGQYDFRAILSDGSFATLFGLTIASGQVTTVTVNQPVTTGSIRTQNNTSLSVTELHVAPAASAGWGLNQLTSPIPAGGSFLLTSIPPGTYKYRATLSDGTVYLDPSVVITIGVTEPMPLPMPVTVGHIKFDNISGITVVGIYIRPVGQISWGVNQLGAATLPSGSSFTVLNIPAGQYDIRVIWSTGGVGELFNFTVQSGGVQRIVTIN